MNAAADPPTTPGSRGSTPPEPEARWEALIKEWTDCGKGVLDRVAERAATNVGLAREGKYGLGAWLNDVEWFWKGVADDVEQMVAGVRESSGTLPPTGTDPRTGTGPTTGTGSATGTGPVT
jgi:hypothetical protein